MSNTSRLAAMAAVAVAMAGVEAKADPGDFPLWTPSGTTNTTKAPRSKSSHKQNARKQRKARK